MSAEYEAKRNATQSNDIMEKSLKNDSSNNDDDTLEDLAGSANNSLIGKVKSRVSSIIPSSLSKWFSPSTRNNDSLNGSFSVGSARRRRRLEIEDDDYVDDANETNEGEVTAHSGYKENLSGCSRIVKDFDEDDTDNNSEEDLSNETGIPSQRAHYTMKNYGAVRQPPSKRSRISFDTTNVHQPLVASTPAIGISHRNLPTYSSILEDKLDNPTTSHSLRSYTETNAYTQKGLEHQASYAFLSTAAKNDKAQGNIPSKPITNEKVLDNISSRRTLHLPSSSQVANERSSLGFSSTKRQSLSGTMDISKHTAEPFGMNTTTTIIEDEEEAQNSKNEQSIAATRPDINGGSLLVGGSKKQRLNGTADVAEESNADSASECSEGCVENIADLPNNVSLRQRKAGLFNMSSLNSQNGNNSRTSSFGNGINFYSHLEGRKSLFSVGGHSGDPSNTLNNSTLSLTSLNRRQFNASIYGSTSALSDSRLLNTFSPFYKGKTTYGGAAAYKKYTAGAGASRVGNITPTIIRPTSSLSTLSSSNNSLAATTGASNALGCAENTSAISSTAKRILDLINDFATPLSEAKKMANTNVKANPPTLPQAKARLNESDLQTSRAIRLSQVRTPYTRPAVTLQPISRNTSAFPPPVRELQVPSMSQLLQMKKMQNTTERSRQITMQNSTSTARSLVSGEYKLPTATTESSVDHTADYAAAQQQQQQHTNKIKNKSRTSARITATKNATNLELDELPSINLPNIVFPQMQSVPTFDIAVSKPPQNVAAVGSMKNVDNFTKSTDAAKVNSKINSNSIIENQTASTFDTGNNNFDNYKQSKNTENVNAIDKDKTCAVPETKMNFKFSKPLVITQDAADMPTQQTSMNASGISYKFSPPARLNFVESGTKTTNTILPKTQSVNSPTEPQLKRGSVLDALKSTINLTTKDKALSTTNTEMKIGFGDQFKKSTGNKWECETCLIRNDSTSEKCVACETPRTTSTTSNHTAQKGTLVAPMNAGASSFGGQFKMPTDKWECEVCMVYNKEQDDKCVACETRRKGAGPVPNSKLSNNTSNWKPNTFGDAFKPKTNTWECPTCLINNKNDINECVACQTKNPSSATQVSDSSTKGAGTTFKFGFSAANNTLSTQSTTAATSADTGFKSIAASQMSAKWECDACMTRNDAARSKCVCCEQAKPGTTTPDVASNGPKFAFGTTASTKFTFGFGANANESAATGTTCEAISNQKTDAGNTKGFTFGSKPSTSVGFSFGIQQGSATTESKDMPDKGTSSTVVVAEEKTGFKFSAGDVAATNKEANATTSFKFGISSNTGTSNTTTALTTTMPVVKFSTDSNSSKSEAIEPPSVKTTSGGFTFGSSSISNTTSQPAAGGFSFGASAKKTGEETSTPAPTSFTFGAPVSPQTNQTSTTSSTATVKPMFSFGSNTPPTKTTTGSTAAITSTTANTATFSNPAGGFRFGSGSTTGTVATPAAAKALFGSFVTPTTTISAATSLATSSPATTLPKLSAAPTNVFGTFGEITSSSKPTTTTTSTASTPTLASAMLPATTNTNIFGVTPSASASDSKPTASATMIFGSAANNASVANKATGVATNPAQFVFGSSTSNASSTQTSNATAGGAAVAPATSWPKGGFAFGASTVNSGTTNTNETSKPVFGSFMSPAAPVAAACTNSSAGSSVFGSVNVSNTTSGTTATFGSVAANASSVASPGTIFGSSASTAPTQQTPNLFGSVAATTTSAFGASSPFSSGGNINMGNNSATTFGGAASPASTFGSFGSTSAPRPSSSDGASAAKKSEPAFNFGGSTSQIGSSGGFNFGAQASLAPKPAFNFSGSNAPTFNFTGSSGDAAKPFQFGSTPSAPVFNFSGGAVEATPNAPFQFNAGTAPASSNIFAPTPAAPNAPGGGPMPPRRKIRPATRRLTPR